MRSLYLVRHGKPQYPDEHSYCVGQTDFSLSMLGHLQAVLLNEELSDKISGVYCSPLLRTVETAGHMAPELPHIIVSDLSERNLGEWDGLSFDEIRQRWPDIYKARGNNPDHPIPGAETPAASGFRLESVTLEDTLKHPNWVMGQKITVDSATLVNKGLEVMEARWLFDVSLDQIQVVVQPQSVIHSMVEFKDGGIIAQLGTPDMRLPIQYALCYPDRRFLKGDRLDFHMLKQITFEEPDRKTFKGLPMAVEAARAGGSMPTVFNAANELAVRKFLQKKISFLDIYEIIGQSMSRHTAVKDPDLDQILEIEKETYRWIESRW